MDIIAYIQELRVQCAVLLRQRRDAQVIEMNLSKDEYLKILVIAKAIDLKLAWGAFQLGGSCLKLFMNLEQRLSSYLATRAADLTRARRILGWQLKVSYREGFEKTIKWYFANKNRELVKANLDKLLMER